MVKKPVLSETLPSTSSLFWAVPLIFSMLCVNGNIGLHWTNFKRCKTVSLMSHESYAIPRTNSSPRFDFELPAAGDRQLYFQLTLVVDRWLHSQLLVAGDHWCTLWAAGSRWSPVTFGAAGSGWSPPCNGPSTHGSSGRPALHRAPPSDPAAPTWNQNKITFTNLHNYCNYV